VQSWFVRVTEHRYFMVITEPEFDFRFAINEKSNKWYQMERQRRMFFTGSIRFTLPSSRVLRDSTHAVQVNCHLLTKDLCLHHSHIYTIRGRCDATREYS
jgi:hypothetical protein